MQFLFTGRAITESFPEADFVLHIEAESEYVRKLYAEGVVRQFWSRPDVPVAVGIIEAESIEDATSKMAALPLVVLGMLETTIVPLAAYRGFGPRNA